MSTKNTATDHPLAGLWLDPDQAAASASPGRKMMGSAASHQPKWRMRLEAQGTFHLECTTGYDYRGVMSSSGHYDGAVRLTVYRATGTRSEGPRAALLVTAARTTHIHGCEPPMLLPGASPSGGFVKQHHTQEVDGFMIQVDRLDGGQLALRAAELNSAAPVLLVRLPDALP